MKSDTLEFLSSADWERLLEKAPLRPYSRGATILEGGAYSRAIFLVDSGIARVEQAGASGARTGIALAQLGPGEIIGEMSFLEGNSASATVIAESEVQVRRVDEAHLQSLLASDPGFAVRFYQSLAVSLARRLRKTSRRLSQLNVGEVAQVNRFHNPRTGNISARQLPAELAKPWKPCACR